jgi:hypothetical protein
LILDSSNPVRIAQINSVVSNIRIPNIASHEFAPQGWVKFIVPGLPIADFERLTMRVETLDGSIPVQYFNANFDTNAIWASFPAAAYNGKQVRVSFSGVDQQLHLIPSNDSYTFQIPADRSKPRNEPATVADLAAVNAQFDSLKDNDFSGFDILNGNESFVVKALELNPQLRIFLENVIIRAGPDTSKTFYGANGYNQEGERVILIATNDNNGNRLPDEFLTKVLIHELTAISLEGKGLSALAIHNLATAAENLTAQDQGSGITNWIIGNKSDITGLPYSFQIPADLKQAVFLAMGAASDPNAIIERGITDKGLVIYDGAASAIFLISTGDPKNLETAFVPLKYYAAGSVIGQNIIAKSSDFVYLQNNPNALTQNNTHGFIFRIINADGRWAMADPLDGKTRLAGFPEQDAIHWMDWKPIAGENAWVVMQALQYYNANSTSQNAEISLNLAEDLARAAILLQ